MSKPLVSVIVPFNRIELRNCAINNFLKQDYENKELFLIGNSDTYETNSTHWCVYGNHGNISIGAKRNYGCRISHGGIILHMDDDDYYAQDWISKSVEALGDHEMTG